MASNYITYFEELPDYFLEEEIVESIEELLEENYHTIDCSDESYDQGYHEGYKQALDDLKEKLGIIYE